MNGRLTGWALGLASLSLLGACTRSAQPFPPVAEPAAAAASTESIDELKAKAQGGDAASQIKLGARYESGSGVARDYAEAMSWFQKALPANPAAANEIGVLYYYGWGVPRDATQAAQWFRRGAVAGVPAAQRNLADRYRMGEGVDKNMVPALYWYQKAAEAGDAAAQIQLGLAYQFGQGVPKGTGQDVFWYGKAAEQGNPAGETLLATVYLTPGRDSAFPYSYHDRALRLYYSAAEQGFALAQYDLGVVYSSNAYLVKRNPGEAVKWFRLAAAQNYVAAQAEMGNLYARGWGVDANDVEASRWYLLAAQGGNAAAQSSIGVRYLHGTGIFADPVEAAKWLTLAANQGVRRARAELAGLYESGRGIEKNLVLAYMWAYLAASLVQDPYLELTPEELCTGPLAISCSTRDRVGPPTSPEEADERRRAQQIGLQVLGRVARQLTTDELAEARRMAHRLDSRARIAGSSSAMEAPSAVSAAPAPVASAQGEEPHGGDAWRDPVTGMEFVWVPGGTFEMGCGSWNRDCKFDENPAHPVTVSGFYLGKTEVTQGQWKRIMGKNPSDNTSMFKNTDNYPVEQVSWNDAQEFIWRLNEQSSGARYRLPTEAEWEYACRAGGKEQVFSWGDREPGAAGEKVANLWDKSGRRRHPKWIWGGDPTYDDGFAETAPVASFPPNGLGLFDMNGNVDEWVQDAYEETYSSSPAANPVIASGALRVSRGGGWNDIARVARCSSRLYKMPSYKIGWLGLRLARTNL